jgi:hypothetical protein
MLSVPKQHPAFEVKRFSPNVEKKKSGKNEEEDDRLSKNRDCFKAVKKQYVITKPKAIKLWFNQEIDAKEIIARRRRIKDLLGRVRKPKIDDKLLDILIKGYDTEFFNGKLYFYLKKQSTDFKLTIGDEKEEFKKGVAAFCKLAGDEVSIIFHKDIDNLQFNSRHDARELSTECEEINGILCWDKIDCVQSILEHELVHLIMQVFLRQLKAPHGKAFKELAKGLWAHSMYNHAIGYGTGMERVEREQDREKKFNEWKVKDVVSYTADEKKAKQFGMIVLKSKETVVLMSTDASLVEKVPYADLGLAPVAPIDPIAPVGESKDDTMPDTAGLKEMLLWTQRFLNTKKKLKVGSTVSYSNIINVGDSEKLVQGTVSAKKQTCAQIRVSPMFSSLIPYHCLT